MQTEKQRIKKHVNGKIFYAVFQFSTNTLLTDTGNPDGVTVLHRKKQDMINDWRVISDGECERIIKVKVTAIS